MSEYHPHRCDFCPGTVHPVRARQEPLRVGETIVVIEGAMIGKCDRCGHRYFPADVIKRAEEAARNPEQALRTVTFPVIAA